MMGPAHIEKPLRRTTINYSLQRKVQAEIHKLAQKANLPDSRYLDNLLCEVLGI